MSTLNSVLLAQWAVDLEKQSEIAFEKEIESIRKNNKKVTCCDFFTGFWEKLLDAICCKHPFVDELIDNSSDSSSETF